MKKRIWDINMSHVTKLGGGVLLFCVFIVIDKMLKPSYDDFNAKARG